MSTPLGSTTTTNTKDLSSLSLEPKLAPSATPPRREPEVEAHHAEDHHAPATTNRFGENVGVAAGGVTALQQGLELAEHFHVLDGIGALTETIGVAAVALNTASVYETSPAMTTAGKLAHAALAGAMSASLEITAGRVGQASQAVQTGLHVLTGANAVVGATELAGAVAGGPVEHYAEQLAQVSPEKLMNGATGAIVVLLEAAVTGDPAGMIAFQKQAVNGKYGIVFAQILDPQSISNRIYNTQSALVRDLASAYTGVAKGDLQAMKSFEQKAAEGRYGSAIQLATQEVRRLAA